MDFLTIQTPAGPLGVVGRIHTDQTRPALLVVNGAFPPRDIHHDLIDDFSGVNVLVVNLPGMLGVPWARPTLALLTQGLEGAARLLLGDSPLVVFGVSAGNLLTLGLKLPTIWRRVALEPFFETQHLWPFIANSRERMAQSPENTAMTHYFWEFFGIGPNAIQNRDYRYLIDNISVPTDVLVAHTPLLPPRPAEYWPSFCSQEDRDALAANPFVKLMTGPPGTGHSYTLTPPTNLELKRVLRAALVDVAQRQAAASR